MLCCILVCNLPVYVFSSLSPVVFGNSCSNENDLVFHSFPPGKEGTVEFMTYVAILTVFIFLSQK